MLGALFQPKGVYYDPSMKRIVGLHPKPGLLRAMQIALEPEGREGEEETGTLWNKNPNVTTPPQFQTIYGHIVAKLRNGPATFTELTLRMGKNFRNIHVQLRRMLDQGFVPREWISTKREYRYL